VQLTNTVYFYVKLIQHFLIICNLTSSLVQSKTKLYTKSSILVSNWVFPLFDLQRFVNKTIIIRSKYIGRRFQHWAICRTGQMSPVCFIYFSQFWNSLLSSAVNFNLPIYTLNTDYIKLTFLNNTISLKYLKVTTLHNYNNCYNI
jgi:hypothetical protein